MSLQDCRLGILDQLLDLIWSQWTTMGVFGNAPIAEKWVLDPEALVLFTCNIGRYDPRVFDSMLAWLEVNERLLNVQRLKTIRKREKYQDSHLLTAIAHLLIKPISRSKWMNLSEELPEKVDKGELLFQTKDGSPFPQIGEPDPSFNRVGYIRSTVQNRKNAVVQFNPELPANLILKLRALFGLNSRCEVIAYLKGHQEGNPTQIAAATAFAPKTVYNVIQEIHMSGLLDRRVRGRETLYALRSSAWDPLLAPGGKSADWMDWPRVYRVLEILWAALDNPWLEKESLQVAASEIRLAFQRVGPTLQEISPQLARYNRPTIELSRVGFDDICTQTLDLIRFLT